MSIFKAAIMPNTNSGRRKGGYHLRSQSSVSISLSDDQPAVTRNHRRAIFSHVYCEP